MITGRREEHLGLVLQPPERLAVNHSIPIALERRTNRILWLWAHPAAAVGAFRGLGRENLAFTIFELLPEGHNYVGLVGHDSCAMNTMRR
jgi:hypothetical protein